MAKFSRKGKPAPRREEGGEEKRTGRSAYKAKRSFTRNKGLRTAQKDKDGKRPFRGKDTPYRDRPFRERQDGDRKPRRNFENDRERTSGDNRKERRFRERSSDDRNRERPYNRDREQTARGDRDRPSRTRDGSSRGERPYNRERSGDDRGTDRPFRRERPGGDRRDKPAYGERSGRPARPGRRDYDRDDAPKRVRYEDFDKPRREPYDAPKKPSAPKKADDGLIRLNKYLSNAGVASRREADQLITSGAVKVNGVVIDQLGYKIRPGDKVTYGDQAIRGEKKVYLLLNKPKDYITTVEDERGRKTVMELIAGACRERVYPVGRLDRTTTGLLLMTNDGDLTTRLTHPKYGVKKVYHVSLDKSLKTTDFKALTDGIELEDGPARADDLAFVGEGKREVGIEIHSGRNRIVRRMFEHLGYKVVKLDRVVFAGLTKKDLPRGKHRFLTAKEVAFLKMIG